MTLPTIPPMTSLSHDHCLNWLASASLSVVYPGWAVGQVFAGHQGTRLRGGGPMLLICLIAGGVLAMR